LREGRESRTDMTGMKLRKDEVADRNSSNNQIDNQEYHDPSDSVKQEPVRVGPKVGRNDPCPCGSGKKFKACHGKDQ